jgi:hypothetical protein
MLRGTEYLEDGLLARRLADAEKQNREIIKKLEVEAGNAFVELLMAQEAKKPLQEQKRLQEESDRLQAKLEAAQKQAKAFLNGGSINLIQAGLGSLEEKKPSERKEPTKSIRDFSEKDMEKINQHYENLDDDLKGLMSAAIGEVIDLG